MPQLVQTVAGTLDTFVDGIAASLPSLLAGLLFLLIAAVVIRIILWVLRALLGRSFPGDEQLLVDLAATVVGIFLWFGAALSFLTIVGMGDIAASLGTAAGFIALGISYALSNMIADTVAGVYLLRDPDFEAGDRVVADNVTGTVTEIGLRKSRLMTDDGDRVVLANRDVDKKWTKKAESITE